MVAVRVADEHCVTQRGDAVDDRVADERLCPRTARNQVYGYGGGLRLDDKAVIISLVHFHPLFHRLCQFNKHIAHALVDERAEYGSIVIARVVKQHVKGNQCHLARQVFFLRWFVGLQHFVNLGKGFRCLMVKIVVWIPPEYAILLPRILLRALCAGCLHKKHVKPRKQKKIE